MIARARIERSSSIEAPAIETIAMQVRTSASIPFAAHMLGDNPAVDTIAMQVRTSASVPFADYMKAQDKVETPTVETVGRQVRTSASVPFADYMLGEKRPVAHNPVSRKK